MEKVAIHDIRSDQQVHGLPDEELLQLHHRLHQQYGAARARGEATEYPWTNVHLWVVEEFRRRGMQHHVTDDLDREAERLSKAAPDWVTQALAEAKEAVLVPAYLSLVGSATMEEEPRDVDLLLREDEDQVSAGWRESVVLLARKVLDPDKARGVRFHLLCNPQGPHLAGGQGYIPLFDLVLRPRPAELVTKETQDPVGQEEALRPIARYTPMKPRMAGYTDFRDLDELWEAWGEDAARAAPLYVSPKVDGFRTLLQRQDGEVSIRFSDTGEERADALPDLVEALRRGPTSFILEGELQAVAGSGRYIARPQILSMLAGDLSATPTVFLYDVLYWEGEDVHDQPFADRLPCLQEAARRLGDPFVFLPQWEVRTKQDLERAARDALRWKPKQGKGLPIEGVVVRRADMPYVFGPSDLYAKTKRYVELKLQVIRIHQAAGGYTYEVGLRGTEGEVVPLGRTFVSQEKLAGEGDTLNVQIEELLLYPDGQVAMGKPTPLGPDRSRPAYTVPQAVDLARRYGVLKEIVEKAPRGGEAGEGGEARSEAALRNWEEHWHEAMPISGRALPWVLHAHVRGLSEEEARLNLDDLLDTDHSLHFDLRLGTDRFRGWWGISLFAGTMAENRETLRIFRMMHDAGERLESAPKQFGPTAWLTVGLKEPLVVEPGGAGATSRAWSKFFALDHGTWRLGMARVHGVELWLDGERLKGRFLWQYAPLGRGEERHWLFTRPEDQRAYAEGHDLGDLIQELAGKGQRWLFWPKDPSDLSRGLDQVDVQEAARHLRKYHVVKADGEQRYTLGIAYPANRVDAHGDFTTPEELERTAWNYLRRVQAGQASVGLLHRTGTDGAGTVVESYIYRGPAWQVGEQTVRAGDWLVGVIWSEQAWDLIRRGEINGYSIQGLAWRE